MLIYDKIIKPILFWINIEQAHHAVVLALRMLGRLPFGDTMLRNALCVEHPSLERDVFGVHFKNPIGMAAGFDVNGEITNELDAIGFGYIEVGAITPDPQDGNPKPRVYRLSKDRAIINRMGNPNRGWEAVILNLRRRNPEVIVGCNITNNRSTEPSKMSRDLLKSFRNLYQYANYFTVNIDFNHLIITDQITPIMAITNLLNPLIDFRRGQSEYRPIMLKVTPDLSDEMIDAVTDVLISTPLDGVVAINGTQNREGLKTSEINISKIGVGRLSGEPIKERALEVVRRIYNRSGGAYPIIGVGGIQSADDVRAMMEAGASLVQIYSSLIYNGPTVVGDICRELIAQKPTPDSAAPLSEIP